MVIDLLGEPASSSRGLAELGEDIAPERGHHRNQGMLQSGVGGLRSSKGLEAARGAGRAPGEEAGPA
jgi:hypothetical protein